MFELKVVHDCQVQDLFGLEELDHQLIRGVLTLDGDKENLGCGGGASVELQAVQEALDQYDVHLSTEAWWAAGIHTRLELSFQAGILLEEHVALELYDPCGTTAEKQGEEDW